MEKFSVILTQLTSQIWTYFKLENSQSVRTECETMEPNSDRMQPAC